jgi:hypothetical protein
MIRYSQHGKCVLLAACALGAAACFGPGDITGDDVPDPTGTIIVGTLTIGANPDPDGYLASVEEGVTEPIAVNGAVTFEDLRVGTHNVLLSGLNGLCVVTTANPVLVLLLPDSTVTTQFEINCP